MKFQALVLAFFWMVTTALAQPANYFVVHVKGDIEVKATKKKLQINDQISSDDELRFLSADAKAVVMSTKQGRMVIDGSKSQKNSSGEFISFVRDVVLPGKENIKLSTRGPNAVDFNIDYKTVNNFKKFFGDERYVIIGDELRVGTDLTRYPINEQNRFIYRYETAERPVNKKLHYEGNNLVINRQVLYKTKGTQIDPDEAKKVELIYFNFSNNEATPLASFNPVFVDEKTLLLELKSVATFLESNNIMQPNQIKDELFDFILEVHGPINRNVFNDWMASKDLITKR
jgi:hypothetical protein